MSYTEQSHEINMEINSLADDENLQYCTYCGDILKNNVYGNICGKHVPSYALWDYDDLHTQANAYDTDDTDDTEMYSKSELDELDRNEIVRNALISNEVVSNALISDEINWVDEDDKSSTNDTEMYSSDIDDDYVEGEDDYEYDSEYGYDCEEFEESGY